MTRPFEELAQQMTSVLELSAFSTETSHSSEADCYETDGQEKRDPDNCHRCYLEQLVTDLTGEIDHALQAVSEATREHALGCDTRMRPFKPKCLADIAQRAAAYILRSTDAK